MQYCREIEATKKWLDEFVIGLNLCPFARHAVPSIEYIVSDASTEQQLLADLEQALLKISEDPAIETLLLIHPLVLLEFTLYNEFLSVVDALLQAMNLEGEVQVASFHPDYQFADTHELAADNFTNRSPYPMLHLLREASVEKAVNSHPDVDDIPSQNIKQMRELGYATLSNRLNKLRG